VLVKPMYGGERCPALTQTKSCYTHSCPRDCLLGKWSDWSQCTKSCNSGDSGPGTWFATRKVLRETAFGGQPCRIEEGTTLTKKVQNCNDRPCPIDCAVTDWKSTDGTRGIWSKCSRSCAAVLQSGLRDIAHAKKGTNALAYHSRQREAKTITAQRLGTRALPDGMKLDRNGLVVDSENKPVKKLFGGRGCPHLFEKENCNSYSQCMKLFMSSTGTSAIEHEKQNWKKLLSRTTTKDTLQNGKAKATTPPPTPFTTPAPVITKPDVCVMRAGKGEKPVILQHGWHGAGIGSNWCNLCRCNDGAISCQKRKCGTDGLMRGTECSHTTCKLDDSGEHSLIIVQHSHRENFGRHHHCAYMPGATAIDDGPKLQRNCRCHCFGNTFKELLHGTKGAFSNGNYGVRSEVEK